MIAYELKRGNPVGFILVETLNGLDAFHRKEGSKLLCRKSSSPSGIIPNFCLGSQPSEIPLIFAWVAFWFSTHRGTLYRLLFTFFSLMLSFLLLLFSFYSFLSLSLSLSLLFQIWLQALRLLQPPTIPLSTYLPKHLRDRQLH